jgi:hypothetical protein
MGISSSMLSKLGRREPHVLIARSPVVDDALVSAAAPAEAYRVAFGHLAVPTTLVVKGSVSLPA